MSTGLQTIINHCNSIKINRRNVVGIQFTRNEIPRVSQTPTLNPWKITLEMPNSFKYSDARNLLEEIDTLDAIYPQEVTFGDNANLRWIWAYRGEMTSLQASAITVQSYVGNQLTLTGLPAVSSGTYLFKKNDLIQIVGHPYPFTTEDDVLRGSSSTVVVTTSRPNINSTSVVGSGLNIGPDCIFNVFCPNMPVYKLIPGGYEKIGNTIINNALIEWSDNFFLYEFCGQA